MKRLAIAFVMIVLASLFVGSWSPADGISIPVPGLSDCKDAPSPSTPGDGVPGFFERTPNPLPPQGDPFAPGATTTIYEQYGYAGFRWDTYDLGCGPDMLRSPDAVVGTAMANWMMQLPLTLTSLTGSVTQVAFKPSFLDVFDPTVSKVSTALHQSLFATWVPAVVALLGTYILFRANRAALATTAAAIGWALIVVLLATAVFRWPVEAGHAADGTVTSTLGAVVSKLDSSSAADPGTAVSSNVTDAILYRSWLSGELGSADSATAKKYGPALFKAHALTWREAATVSHGGDAAKAILDQKAQDWKTVADQIKEADPSAYSNLQGHRSETRIGYSFLATIATVLALPFLLLSALLLLGCFLIVRLAVMLFPAFATLGVFPSARGLVIGLGRTVGAAVVNSIVFGVGAGITIAVLGLLMHPSGAPAWLGLVLMPLFSVIMWVALKPFRRLTSMVSPNDHHFRRAGDAVSEKGSAVGSFIKTAGVAAVGAATGGAAGAAVVHEVAEQHSAEPPETQPLRTWERPERPEPEPTMFALAAPRSGGGPAPGPPSPAPSGPAPAGAPGVRVPSPSPGDGFVPEPTGAHAPLMPTEPEWDGHDEVYTIYRPASGLDGSSDGLEGGDEVA